jgi:tetratricopeptide (TPR) repeat protein
VRPLTDRPTPAWLLGLAALVLAGAAALAYRNGLAAPFVFDDVMGIERNESIRHLWPPAALLHPPFDTSVTGRPFLNYSFAVSYALGGERVQAYHVANIVIHLLAGLALFGLVRRTLPRASPRYSPGDCTLLGFVVALLWLVHPLQTESVTYLIQRAEALMGLFYLLTLYCFVRATEEDARNSTGWLVLSFLCCFLGMATKEVMASAPVIVLLYDRTFVAGSWREAWRRRRGYYLGLASTWVLVAWLALGTKSRNGTAGFGIGVRWGDYLLTQASAITRYLQLAFFPRHQAFDYGAQWVGRAWSVLPQALLVAVLAGATLWALWRRPALGFLGAWFFAILAPTSLIPGNRQTIAEHRMYLALAPLVVLVALLAHRAAAGLLRDPRRRTRAILALAGALALVLGVATARRNAVYLDVFGLWQDTVAKTPGNFYARNNLGNLYLTSGQVDAALAQYDAALRLKPDFPEGHNNHGTALAHAGRPEEAKAEYRAAIRLRPEFYPDAHNNLGVALARDGDDAGALAEFQGVLRVRPDYLEVYFNEGNALAKLGRAPEAIAAYRAALDRGLKLPALHNNLGNALASLGRTREALAQYVAAVRLDPGYADAYNNLGTALAKSHRLPEAIKEYQQSVWLRPRATESRLNLANALAHAGRLAEAETQYREVLQMDPDSFETRNNLGTVLAQDGLWPEAIGEYEAALRLNFSAAAVHDNLGTALLHLQRRAEARQQFEIALQLQPGLAEARQNLNRLQALSGSGPRLHPRVPGL